MTQKNHKTLNVTGVSSMSMGLLASLRKYPSKEKHNPLENFITECFAWILRTDVSFSEFFINKIRTEAELDLKNIDFKKAIWKTQENFDNSYPDMVCYLDNRVIVFENKAWSELSSNQLKKYSEYASSHFEKSWIVLITATKNQHKQNADLSMCWNDIHQYMEEWVATKEDVSFIFRDFIELLEVEGMGPPAPISHEGLTHYYTVSNLEENIVSLIKKNKERNWSEYFEGQSIDPWYHKRWGRVGMNFLSWHPVSIFIGVMLDGSDHCTTPIDLVKGPDACVILSFENKLHKEYPLNEHYKLLTSILSEKICNLNSGWQFYNHLKDTSARRKNKYHPIHIRKPLKDILLRTTTPEEQEKEFFKQLSEILSIIMKETPFLKLRESLSRE